MSSTAAPSFWSRAIILIDMNAFFASIEQLDHPAWRGRPLAVTNGMRGSCVITCSYEARRFGVKTGMRLRDALDLCPGLIRCAARPRRYSDVSRSIMAALTRITPDIEVFSVDEAFLDVSHCQRLHGSPQQVARLVKETVFATSGLLCSIGLSGDKTTAKFAAKLDKPNGFCVITPADARQRLAKVPVTDLCGIAKGIGRFLAAHGVYYCGDMHRLPISVLARRFGNPGRRIWYMCQGMDPEGLHKSVPAPKSIGHGKVMPPRTQDRDTIVIYLLHMAEKVGRRLRRHDFQAQHFFVGLRGYENGFIGAKRRLSYPTQDGAVIYRLALSILSDTWCGEPVGQVQITALDPHLRAQQIDFFEETNEQRERVNTTIDRVNDRFGEFTLAAARLLYRSSMPNVIAPAWKPDGHRQTIE